MAEHCQSGKHGSTEIPLAIAVVEYTGDKFGGTEEKALCPECHSAISKQHHYEVTVLRVIAASPDLSRE